MSNKSNTTDMTKGAETVFPSGAHEFITDFSGILAFVNHVFA
jgi:hypothetical protein